MSHSDIKYVKRLRIVFTITMLAVLLTACQATPSEIVVIGEAKNNAQEITAEIVNDESLDFDGANIPNRYNATIPFTELNMEIVFDAEVLAPKKRNFAITKMKAMNRSDIEHDELIKRFSNGLPLYEYREKTVSDWQSILLSIMQKHSQGHYGDEFEIDNVTQEIENYTKDAPATTENKPFDWGNHHRGELCIIEFDYKGRSEQIQLIKDGNYFCYSRYDDYVIQTEDIVQSGGAISGEPDNTIIDVQLSEETARAQSESVVNDMCKTEYYCDNSMKARVVEPYSGEILTTGWLFTYTRIIDDLVAYPIGQNYRISNKVFPSLVAPWSSEVLEVFVDEKGIVFLSWKGAANKEGVARDLVEIMEFADIVRIVGNQMKYCHANKSNPDHKCIITIHQMSLGTSLLSIANSDSQYGQYVPSWYAFYSLQIEGAPEIYIEDCMVFTATDGRYVEPRMTMEQLMEMQ